MLSGPADVPVLVAAGGAAWETAALEELSRRGTAGVVLHKRCVDLTDLVATSATGLARAALVGDGLPVVDLPDAGHHPMLDQPLALVTGIRTLLAFWPDGGARTA